MVNVTLSLPEEIVKKLRQTAEERYGGRKGALSGIVRESLEEYLRPIEEKRPPIRFKAFRGESQIAEAGALDELATKLEDLNGDPRSVRVISTEPVRPEIRMGLRGKPS